MLLKILASLFIAASLVGSTPAAAREEQPQPNSKCFVTYRPIKKLSEDRVMMEYRVTCDTGWRVYLRSPFNGMPKYYIGASDGPSRDVVFRVPLDAATVRWYPVTIQQLL